MSSFGPQALEETLEACRIGAPQVATAFTQALDMHFQAPVQEAAPLPDSAQLAEPGLVFGFRIGPAGAVALLTGASGWLPAALATNPDQIKLSLLATQLGMLLFPEEWLPEDSKAAYTANLAEALEQAKPTGETAAVRIGLSTIHGQGELFVVWPVAEPEQALNPTKPSTEAKTKAGSAARTRPARPQVSASSGQHAAVHEGGLPSYTRSLLKIQVPVTVSLATKKQPVGRIVQLGPGSIIQFSKPCEELLELEVNGQKIAVGEAVKVGDKFGLRLASLILPDERFVPLGQGPFG